jgi:hypothetical protein
LSVVLAALGCSGGDSLTGRGGAGGTTGLGGQGGDAGGPPGGTTGTGGLGGSGGPGGSPGPDGGTAGQGGTSGTTFTGSIGNEVDILLMVDNSSSMTEMQQKLYDQLPLFMQAIQGLPIAPSLHLAVVSSDLGAPGDATSSIQCTTSGDQGQFQSMPRGTCAATSLTNGATFISDADMTPNYTDANISDVVQCIALLGDKGCGFEHQLASIDRALGADGSSPPSTNSGFLRPNASLAIVILTNEDDCSAPPNTKLYSLAAGGSNQQNIANALGPISNYRCNAWGHLCTNPATGQLLMPPLTPPSSQTMLNLTSCLSNDTGTGLLTPVSTFVSDIRALKPDPDNQIVVAAISGPPTPYTVAWVSESGGQNTQPGELWPQIEHSCGPVGFDDVNPASTMSTTDGSFADPGVRIAQFVKAFPRSFLGSICDASYAATMMAIAARIGGLITPPCITGTVQSVQGIPACTVRKGSSVLPNCAQNGNQAPCWSLVPGTGSCVGQSLAITETAATRVEPTTFSCTLCPAGSSGVNGC